MTVIDPKNPKLLAQATAMAEILLDGCTADRACLFCGEAGEYHLNPRNVSCRARDVLIAVGLLEASTTNDAEDDE